MLTRAMAHREQPIGGVGTAVPGAEHQVPPQGPLFGKAPHAAEGFQFGQVHSPVAAGMPMDQAGVGTGRGASDVGAGSDKQAHKVDIGAVSEQKSMGMNEDNKVRLKCLAQVFLLMSFNYGVSIGLVFLFELIPVRPDYVFGAFEISAFVTLGLTWLLLIVLLFANRRAPLVLTVPLLYLLIGCVTYSLRGLYGLARPNFPLIYWPGRNLLVVILGSVAIAFALTAVVALLASRVLHVYLAAVVFVLVLVPGALSALQFIPRTGSSQFLPRLWIYPLTDWLLLVVG